jgi:hypothetical protein
MFVKPAPGRSVPDPERHGLLAADGRVVDPTSAYWTRRLDDGDVELVDPADTPPGSIVEKSKAAAR